MTKYTLKPLTDTSWILNCDGNRVGLVSKIDQQLKIIGKVIPGKYLNFDAISAALGTKLIIEQPIVDVTQDKETGEVGGFPIKHNEWHNILLDKTPSYTRVAKSEARYAAGYFGLKFPNGWTPSFCPKLATLNEYEYIGPFTTKLEMQQQISSKNKITNV